MTLAGIMADLTMKTSAIKIRKGGIIGSKGLHLSCKSVHPSTYRPHSRLMDVMSISPSARADPQPERVRARDFCWYCDIARGGVGECTGMLLTTVTTKGDLLLISGLEDGAAHDVGTVNNNVTDAGVDGGERSAGYWKRVLAGHISDTDGE